MFADNERATVVAKTVGISLDSARGIRDREHAKILRLREKLKREYERLWEREIEANYKRQEKVQCEQLWQEILKKQNALKLAHTAADSSRAQPF
jgi:hypothetical protein